MTKFRKFKEKTKLNYEIKVKWHKKNEIEVDETKQRNLGGR